MQNTFVAPHAGAWIEIAIASANPPLCGVAPHAGAWIEIEYKEEIKNIKTVAPHAGAWIEIGLFLFLGGLEVSLPTRERGLKFLYILNISYPFPRRSPRGSVD